MTPPRFNKYFLRLGMGTHPKLARLTDSERCAHVFGVLALAAASPRRGCLLVGDLPAEAVDVAAASGVSRAVAASALRKLQAVGVLYADSTLGCLVVHDWDDVNPPPKTDSTNAERQANYRARNASSNAESNGQSNAPVTAVVTGTEVEVEEEDHLSAKADSPAAAPPPADEYEEAVAFLTHLLSAEVRTTHGIPESSKEALPIKAWKDACRSMLASDGYNADQIEYAIRWVCRHHYWSRRIKSMTRLRSEMGQVAKEIREQRTNGATVTPIRPGTSDLIRKLRENEEAS